MRLFDSFLRAVVILVLAVCPAFGQVQNPNVAVATTAAPTYTQDTRNPLSTDLSGALRITGGTALPISGTVTANQGGTWTVTVNSPDPCSNGTILSVPIDTASSGNVQLVALSGTTIVYVCGYNFIVSGTVVVQMISGTGSACATNELDETGPYSLTAQTGINTGFSGQTVFAGLAGDAVCIELSATIQTSGMLSYKQQ